MTSIAKIRQTSRLSSEVASEIRAELGRQGINQTELSRRLGVTQVWLSRRIGASADVDLRVDDVAETAKALDVPAERLLAPMLLPRLDSNQQPSGYRSALVIDLDNYRHTRLARAS